MANPEHVEIAKQGKMAMAAFLERHREMLDLNGADLQGANLCDAFIFASLDSANLRGANMAGCVFYRTNPEEKGMNMSCACLVNADLSDAELDGVDLYHADVRGADMTGITGVSAAMLARTLNLEHALLDAGRYADAVAAGYKPTEP